MSQSTAACPMLDGVPVGVLETVLLATPDPTSLARACRLLADVANTTPLRCEWYRVQAGRHPTPYTWRLVSALVKSDHTTTDQADWDKAEVLILALLQADEPGRPRHDAERTLRSAVRADHPRVVRMLLDLLPAGAQPAKARQTLVHALTDGALAVASSLFDLWFPGLAEAGIVDVLAYPAASLDFILRRRQNDRDDTTTLVLLLRRLLDRRPCAKGHVAVLLAFCPALAGHARDMWLRQPPSPAQDTTTAWYGDVDSLRAVFDPHPGLLASTTSAHVLTIVREPSHASAALSALHACGWTGWSAVAAQAWPWVRHACACGHAGLLADMFARQGGASRRPGLDEARELQNDASGSGRGSAGWAGRLVQGWWDATDQVQGDWARALGVILDSEADPPAAAAQALLLALEALSIGVKPGAVSDIVHPLAERCGPDDLALGLCLAATHHLHAVGVALHAALRKGGAANDGALRRVLPLVLPSLVVAFPRPDQSEAQTKESCRRQLLRDLLMDAERLGAVPVAQLTAMGDMAGRLGGWATRGGQKDGGGGWDMDVSLLGAACECPSAPLR